VSGRATRFQLQIHAAGAGHAVAFLESHLRRAHRMLKSPLAQLSVGLVNQGKMAALHHRFLGRRGATDVLSFEIDRDRRGRVTAGEVVICVPLARRQAAARGIPLANELLLYALHGMLHLCGFDDRTESAFLAMHAKEDEILTRLGVGPVFRPSPPAAPRRRFPSGVRR
jgi:probable rRNA maturation factor